MKNIVDFLKLPPRILGALSVASGLLLFLPNAIIEKLYMTSFCDKYGFAIGIVFVVSTSILVVFLVVIIAKKIKDKYYNKRLKKARIAYLKRIDGNKVELIRYLLNESTHTAMLPMHDGMVLELQHFYVILPAGSTHAVNMADPQINYFLQPWVIEEIDGDPELKAKFGR